MMDNNTNVCFDEQMDTTLVSSCENKHHIKEKPYVTTITICIYLDNSAPDIDDIIKSYDDTTGVFHEFIQEVLGGKDEFFPSRRNFMNSIIFTLKSTIDDATKVAVKCFKNGSLHITGVRTIKRALTIAQAFCIFYGLISTSKYNITDFDIQMINAHFSFDVQEGCLHLSKMFDICLQETEHECMYNNERHAGVIVKYLTESMKKVSIIVFESGNVLICAFCTSTQFVESWNFITDFIKRHWNDLIVKERMSERNGTKRVKRSVYGFDYGKYIQLK